MEIQEDKIRQVLNRIKQPATREGLADIGLIREITYREG